MKTLINRFGTPLTAGLFIVSAISGAALFFHWQSGAFRSMHEWLSMVLLVPFVLHVWKNWRPLLGYMKRALPATLLVGSLLAAVPFAVAGLSGGERGGGNPAFRAVGLVTGAPLADVAPLLKTTPDALVESLKTHGYQVASADETLESVATASGAETREVLFAVMPQR